MSYFDPFQPPDRALLHSDVRDHDEASTVAKQAERDVIRRYTERLGRTNVTSENEDPYRYTEGDFRFQVNLTDYHADETQAGGYDANRSEWTGLCEALRDAIARVTSHRLRYYDRNEDVIRERRGERTTEYRESGADPRWPDGWDAPLQDFDLRTPLYAI